MKQYKGYEVTAINTGGYWYGYASKDGVTVFSDTKGFKDRNIATGMAEVFVTELVDEGNYGQTF